MTDMPLRVQQGYDRVSRAYREDRLAETSDDFLKYRDWMDELLRHLPPAGDVLDLGCGCGEPVARLLAATKQVTGVDISPVQIDRATSLLPQAKFICSDMCDLAFTEATFDAIVCLYAIIHVPLDEQPALLGNMGRWLKPGGHLLITVGQSAWTGGEANWLGVVGGDMYWSHADRATYLRWLEEAGLQLLWERFIPEGNGGHPLLLLRKPGGRVEADGGYSSQRSEDAK